MMTRAVMRCGGVDDQGAAAFGQGAHQQQHAFDIRVPDDGDGLIRGAVHWPPLHPLVRIGNGFLAGTFG